MKNTIPFSPHDSVELARSESDAYPQLCLHTITTKPWSLQEALDHYSEKKVGGISVWQDAIKELGAVKAGQLLQQYPIEVVSYVRGGFFPSVEANKRQMAIDNNKKLLDEAAAIGAPLLVLVCGAEPRQTLGESRQQIREGIEAILSHAQSLGLKLGIEPLHPMYADTRSAVNTIKQANDLVTAIGEKEVGVVVDVYHLWWDEALEKEIQRCGALDALFAFHICDWKVPTGDMLLDRGLMGEGCIDLPGIRNWVEKAGFSGFHEVEIFSNKYWAMDQTAFLEDILKAYLNYA